MRSALLILLAALAACQSVDSDTARREAYLAAHPETGAEIAAAIRRGEVVVGMTVRETEASLGQTVSPIILVRMFWSTTYMADVEQMVLILDSADRGVAKVTEVRPGGVPQRRVIDAPPDAPR